MGDFGWPALSADGVPSIASSASIACILKILHQRIIVHRHQTTGIMPCFPPLVENLNREELSAIRVIQSHLTWLGVAGAESQEECVHFMPDGSNTY
jgi:hypothetical protein